MKKQSCHRMLAALGLTALAVLFAPSSAPADQPGSGKRDIYELRVYQLPTNEKAMAFDAMMKNGAIPALKRLGVGPVGIFKPRAETGKAPAPGSEHWRYVLTCFQSFEQFATLRDKLAEDPEFLSSAERFLGAKKNDPNYTRIDTSLHIAFTGMPELALPVGSDDDGQRFFELRTYESHSEAAAHLKVDMFNSAEFAIFKSVGLKPVFFGQALAAANLPQLTYLLVYNSEEAKAAAWKAFLDSPQWKELKEIEKYKDTVSRIISTFLVATEASQIR